jgi:hypothetical protein
MFARRYFRRRTVGLEWAAFLLILLVFPFLMLCWDWTDDLEEAEVIEEIVEDVVPDSVDRAGSDPRVLASLAEAICLDDSTGTEFVRWVDLQSYER